jgi:glutaredoxin 3
VKSALAKERNKGVMNMETKRKIEIFSAGCGCCEDTIKLVKSIACPSCDITVLDMKRDEVAQRARQLGVRSVPAVVVDGKLADCCTQRGPDEARLRAAGVGVPR